MKAPRWLVASLATGIVGVSIVLAPPASAAHCNAPIRYSISSNRVYVTGASVSLSDIARLCPSAPLALLDASSKTWLLSADLILDGRDPQALTADALGRPAGTAIRA